MKLQMCADDVKLRFRCLYAMLLFTSTIGLLFVFPREEGVQTLLRETATPTLETEPLSPFGNDRPALAALVTNETHDLIDLCYALKSINVFLNDNSIAPVLIFHENNLEGFQQSFIAACAHTRHVHFPTVDFQSFPPDFDHVNEPTYMERRTKWGYHQMCRFWMTTIWKHSALQEYTTLMRVDSDSCYTKHFTDNDDYNLPYLAEDKVYFGEDKDNYDAKFVIDGLWDLAVDYVGRNNLTDKIAFPALWEHANNSWTNYEMLPIFYNNFEVTRISFMQRPDVAKWHEAVSEREPFGVYRGRWGDAPVRFLTMAMFATPDQVIRREPLGYLHYRDTNAHCMGPILQVTDSYAQMESTKESYSLAKVD